MRQVLRAGPLGGLRGMGWGGSGEGGSGWGTHINRWLIHVNVWQKPLQYCKVISLQLIKINGEKKNSSVIFFTHSLILQGSLTRDDHRDNKKATKRPLLNLSTQTYQVISLMMEKKE